MDSYQKANEIVKEFTAVEVSTTQLYRVTDYYGQQLNKTVNQERTLTPLRQEEVLYVQVDGSMLLTREQGWSEVKVGRYFKSSDCLHPGSKQGWIKASQYVAHLGNHKDFTAAMEPLIESYGRLGSRLVFISDGAVWIKNWITDAFPQAVSILDYYHGCEHLHDFSSQFFKDKEQEREWVKAQKTLLLEGGVATVIQQIEQLTVGNEQGQNLLAYYVANRERMDYKKYRQMGCGIIGSGAIESAHRTVVQRRMKQSGQRWSTKGAQHMLDLRVTKMNGQWAQVIQLAKYGKIATAA